jgi:hypothetical protein
MLKKWNETKRALNCGTDNITNDNKKKQYNIAGINKIKWCSRGQLKCDGTRAETRIRLLEKRTSPFKSARTSVQSTTGSRGVCISGSNVGYTMFRGSVKGIGYPLSTSLPHPCVTVCHHISTGVYYLRMRSTG